MSRPELLQFLPFSHNDKVISPENYMRIQVKKQGKAWCHSLVLLSGKQKLSQKPPLAFLSSSLCHMTTPCSKSGWGGKHENFQTLEQRDGDG